MLGGTALVGACLLLAAIGATQQHVQLADTPKHMSWLAAFLYQAPSWIILAPMSAGVFVCVRRYPPEGESAPARLGVYALASLVFGAVFLAVSVPVRHLIHPAPVLWAFFGAPFYKSAPQWALIGVACFWGAVLVGAYADARRRLVSRGPTKSESPARGAPPVRVSIETRSGRAVLDPAEIVQITASPRGARVQTQGGEVMARASLTRLEQELGEFGIVRVHRAGLVNLAHVREVLGSAHRDGSVRLSTGESAPVSRRRWAALGDLAPGAEARR